MYVYVTTLSEMYNVVVTYTVQGLPRQLNYQITNI